MCFHCPSQKQRKKIIDGKNIFIKNSKTNNEQNKREMKDYKWIINTIEREIHS